MKNIRTSIGAVQQHEGVLCWENHSQKIVAMSDNWLAVVSGDTENDTVLDQSTLQKEVSENIGLTAEEVLGVENIAALEECRNSFVIPDGISAYQQYRFPHYVTLYFGGIRFDGVYYHTERYSIVEIEALEERVSRSVTDALNSTVNRIIEMLRNSIPYEKLCGEVVRHVRTIIGLDRVVFVRLNENKTGTVIAESCSEGEEAWVGALLPLEDCQILRHKRLNSLYMKNDNGQHSSIFSSSQQARAFLEKHIHRVPTPLQYDYFRTMEYQSIYSITLKTKSLPSGLFLCFSRETCSIPLQYRRILNAITSYCEQSLNAHQSTAARLVQAPLEQAVVAKIVNANSLPDAVKSLDGTQLMDVINADGAVVFVHNRYHFYGSTPPKSLMQEIRKYVFAQSSEVVRCNFNNPVHVTDPTMRRLFKEGVSQKPSSMLAITFASSNSIIVWFRDTQTWTRQWVGNPNQRLVTDSIGEQHLHPNIHFRCQEESLEEPLPWSVKDMAVARNIRQGVNELKARRLGELEVINKELQQEIRERKQQELIIRRMLEDRQTLLKEVHHRVKNNLQIISSLLNLSVTSYDIHDSIALDLLVESDNRIRSMALIHEVLYRSDDLSTVSGGAYMHQLSTHLGKTYKRPFVKVRVQAEENIQFNIDTAVSFGFLMNELITNCYKHAFDNEMQGSVVLQLQEENDTTFILKVSDNGPGADKLQQAIGLKEVTNGDAIQKGMGLRLVEDMVRQLRGTLTVDDTFIDGISQGTTVTVVFEQIVYKERLTPSSKQARVRK